MDSAVAAAACVSRRDSSRRLTATAIYAALNDKEQTFKWLQIAYDDRAAWMSYLAVGPVFDSFRSDQRFQYLLLRIHLLP